MKNQKIFVENIPSKEELSFFLEDYKNLTNHEKMIAKALKLAKEIPHIEAVFLIGSLSQEKGDIFSDIDFYLLVEKGDDVFKTLNSFLSNIDKLGNIIHTFQSNAKKNSVIIYIKPYVKFELVVESFPKLSNEWRLGKRASVLFDKNGLGKKAVEKSKSKKFDLSNHMNEIRNLAIELPSFCFLISGYMYREEYITIIDFIAWIRRKLLRISGFFLELWDEGTRRAEERFPKELVNYYNRCKIGEITDVWYCLDTFIEWYSQWLVPNFEKYDIIHANQEVPAIISAIKKIKKKSNNKSKLG
ncbi:MAG: hypothetical protein GF317_15190 [Candidatus Lokiarchaeota archaeon]|nr:hypothetical protein [Candidatus Lokiarchaeota archaeon]MBD3200919.1 hypothetical protein [Candidatus Lokiarchaeota archaeon]